MEEEVHIITKEEQLILQNIKDPIIAYWLGYSARIQEEIDERERKRLVIKKSLERNIPRWLNSQNAISNH